MVKSIKKPDDEPKRRMLLDRLPVPLGAWRRGLFDPRGHDEAGGR